MEFLNLDEIAASALQFRATRHGCEWSLTITKLGSAPSSEIGLYVDEHGYVSFDD
jgi:hypothetical protein